MNKSLCISIATKFKWNHILHLLDVNINSPALILILMLKSFIVFFLKGGLKEFMICC